MDEIRCQECGLLAVIPWGDGWQCCCCGHEFDRAVENEEDDE